MKTQSIAQLGRYFLLPMVVAGTLDAATQTYQDSNPLNTWNVTDANWDAGVPWSDGNDAMFAGTGESVTVDTVSANSITFDAVGYNLTGGTITLAGAPTTITTNANATLGSALATTSGILKTGDGTLTFNNQKTYTGDTVVSAGVLDLTGGGGETGTIRGAVTVNTGAILRLSSGDVTGYGTGVGRLATIALAGGTMNINTTANQTLGNATIQMTGGSITGVANSNLDFFQGSSTVTTLSSATTSTISGVKVSIRQTGGLTFTVASGTTTSGIDLDVSSEVVSNGFTTEPLIKAGPGTMRMTGAGNQSGPTNVTGGKLWVSGTLRNTSSINISTGATLEIGATNMFVTNHGTPMPSSRVINVNGGTLLMNGSFDSRFGNVSLNNGATWTSNRGLGAWDALLANTSAGAATVSVIGSGTSTMNGSGGIHLQGLQNFNVSDTTASSATDLVVDMVLDNAGSAGGTGQLVKLGAGTMRLNKVNTYSGGTIVQEGGILLGTGGANGTIRGTLTVNSGTSVGYTADNAFGYSAGVSVNVLNIVGGTVGNPSGTTYGNHFWNNFQLNMTGGTLYLGGTLNEFHNPTVSVLTSPSTATIQRATGNTTAVIRLRDNTPALFQVEDGAAATDLAVRAPITQSGTSSVTKSGAGTMLLDAQGSYTGGTIVNGGVFAVDGSQVNNRLVNNAQVTVNNPGSVFEVRGVNSLPNHANSVDVTVNSGGTLRVVSGGSEATGAGGTSHAHLRNIVLNGATVDLTYSGGGTAYHTESFQLNGNVTVGGTVASVIQSSGTAGETGVALGGTRTFTVNDVVAGTDLAVSAELEDTDTSPADDGLIKAGAGTMELTGPNSYSGPTTVQAGTLVLSGAATLPSSAVTVADGALFDVSGLSSGSFTVAGGKSLVAGRASAFATDVSGNLVVNGTLRIAGAATTPGTFSLAGGLTLDGAKVHFDLADVTTVGGGVNDLVLVDGNLTLDNFSEIAVNKLASGLAQGTYTLITCTGTLTGDETNLTLTGASSGTTRQTFTLDTDSNNVLLVVGGDPASLVWKGTDTLSPTYWDVTTSLNWAGAPDQMFYDGDNVLFDDTASQFTVDIQYPLMPGSVTVNNTTAYTFTTTTAGSISGTTGLVKTGGGLLTITNDNNFTGVPSIRGGTVSVATLKDTGAASPLGAGSTIELGDASNTGTLQYTGATATFNRPFAVGAGGGLFEVSTAGTVVTHSGAITLAGVLTKSGAGDLTMNGPASGGGALTVQAGTVMLKAANSYAGPTTVVGGTLLADGSQQGNMLPQNNQVTVKSGALFEVRGVNALPTNTGATNVSVDVAVEAGGVFRVVSGASAATGPTTGSHLHVRNINLTGGTVDLPYSGTGVAYDGESLLLKGDLTTGGTVVSTIQTSDLPNVSGVALRGIRTFDVGDATAGTDLLVSAELEADDTTGEADGLIKNGDGTMTLTAANTYAGNTTVNAGALEVNGKLYDAAYNATATVQVSGGALRLASWGYDTVGSLGKLAFASGRVVLNGGNIVLGGLSENSGRGFTVASGGGSLLMETAGETLTLPMHGESPTLPMAGTLTFGGAGNFEVAKALINDGAAIGSLIKDGAGTLTLTGTNTYTGSTAVEGGNLVLASGAGLLFVVTDTLNNGLTGDGSVHLDGVFTIDTSAVTLTSGSWTLVNKTTLGVTFGANFSVAEFDDSDDDGVWTKTVGGKTWSFDQDSGVLSLSGNTYAAWIGGYDFSAFPGADLTPGGDADGDGIENAVEFVIGSLPNQTKVEHLPTAALVSNPPGIPAGEYLRFRFRRTTTSVDAGVSASAVYDAGLAGPWTAAVDGTSGIEIVETPDAGIPGHTVDVYLPRSLEVAGRLFARLRALVP